jgi:hypothetical protein
LYQSKEWQKPHAETTKDPRFNVSPWFSCSETGWGGFYSFNLIT